ncbi:MAG: CusA/CzcA family heavy metal efflux RND transporter [Owenweeksia sp.]|nr:CusA/CzcA family heavy metal efflux RND transporter [Owenweeksia sp.]
MGRAINTVAKNLIEGGLIVVFVLVLLLGNIRAGLIVATIIPLSMLFAFIMMNVFGVSANLMSLGAIDFGIVVDGAVIIVEHILFVIHKKPHAFRNNNFNGFISKTAGEIYRSAAFGVLIILVVFIPILTLEGIEGKMFRPMAQTFGFAVTGALLLSLTYVPAMSALAFRKGTGRDLKFSYKLIEKLQSIYRPIIQRALNIPNSVLVIATVLFVSAIFIFSRMGQEFIPQLDEGDMAAQMTLPPGSGLDESLRYAQKVESRLMEKFPEVKHVVSKIGAAEVPTDPMSVEQADIMIILKPKDEWESAEGREELATKMKNELEVFQGVSFEFTQPIQLRFNELITGAKTDIAIKIFGEDNDRLAASGQRAENLIKNIPGAGDVKVEQTSGLPQMHISVNRENLARYGIPSTEVQHIIRTAYSGNTVGSIFEGQRKFELVVRMNPKDRKKPNLDQLFARSSDGDLIPLSELAEVKMVEGPAQISREQTQRRINVGVNVRDRDLASLVEDIRDRLDTRLELPPGYFIEYGGEFENLESAKQRLMIAVPLALALIYMLLYFAFSSPRLALLIFAAVPLSVIGGIVALWIRDLPFSISAGVGFITLFGVSVLNGIVLVRHLNELIEHDMPVKEALVQGCLDRLRPVIITATVATLGFLPMAISSSAGAEVQRPLATVVIGGLVSATLLTLVVLPVLYEKFYLPIKLKKQNK